MSINDRMSLKRVRNKGMKLYNTYYLCRELKPHIAALKLQDHNLGMNNYYCGVKGWQNYKLALRQLREIDVLRDTIDKIYDDVPPFVTERSEPEISEEKKKALIRDVNTLINKMDAIIELCARYEEDKGKFGVDFKLPKSDTLDDYINNLSDLNFIMTKCPFIINVKDDSITYGGTDVGSEWISFFMKCAGAGSILSCLAAFVDKVFVLKSHYLTLKQQELELEEKKQKGEIREDVIEVFRKMQKEILESAVSDLEKDIGVLDNHEERDYAARSMDKMIHLMDKGLEIYTSIETPQEVQAKFPVIKSQGLLTDAVQKLIEDKKESED